MTGIAGWSAKHCSRERLGSTWAFKLMALTDVSSFRGIRKSVHTRSHVPLCLFAQTSDRKYVGDSLRAVNVNPVMGYLC